MLDVLLAQRGTLDKLIGDAIMVYFGCPIPDERHAVQACRGALAMQRRMIALNARWRRRLPQLTTRIGINTGRAVAGNMGTDTIFNYTILGDCVNLASRLEGVEQGIRHADDHRRGHLDARAGPRSRSVSWTGFASRARRSRSRSTSWWPRPARSTTSVGRRFAATRRGSRSTAPGDGARRLPRSTPRCASIRSMGRAERWRCVARTISGTRPTHGTACTSCTSKRKGGAVGRSTVDSRQKRLAHICSNRAVRGTQDLSTGNRTLSRHVARTFRSSSLELLRATEHAGTRGHLKNRLKICVL